MILVEKDHADIISSQSRTKHPASVSEFFCFMLSVPFPMSAKFITLNNNHVYTKLKDTKPGASPASPTVFPTLSAYEPRNVPPIFGASATKGGYDHFRQPKRLLGQALVALVKAQSCKSSLFQVLQKLQK